MLLGEAKKRCSDLIPIQYDFEGYDSVAHSLYGIVASYTLNIEAVSCDELYADLTELVQEMGCNPLEIASCIRAQIFEETRCPASAGLGPNMLIARLATKKAKPNGQCYIPQKDVSNFMAAQPVGEIPGVGRKTCEKELNSTVL